ncbi:MAG TPA: hypothetical protein VGP90_05360, partial [Acidimicrobiia bacterium]|nr:hypothetical protein [Acidimicrobiia bacterium]
APRVVVYGEYPPFATPGAVATLATVRSLLAEGRDIEVVSPKPSAAHHHAEIGSPRGAARLAALVGGAELVARFDPGILGHSGGAGPNGARAAVGLAVRRARTATIHLSPLTAPPAGKWVRAILSPAERVVAATEEDAARLRAAGLDTAKLSVADAPWWLPAADGATAAAADRPGPASRPDASMVASGASREDIEAEVRRWAAGDRDGDEATPASASWPLHILAPLTPSAAGSSNRWARWVKRGLQRLLAGQINPIVDQVNDLRRATIESLDARPAEPDG